MYLKNIAKNKKALAAVSSSIVLAGIISASAIGLTGNDYSSIDKHYFDAKTAAANKGSNDKYYSQGIPVWRSRDDDPASMFLLRKEVDSEDNRITRVKYRLVDDQSNIVKIAELRCGLGKYREVAISNDGGKTIKENVTNWIWLINGTREWDVLDFSCNHTADAL